MVAEVNIALCTSGKASCSAKASPISMRSAIRDSPPAFRAAIDLQRVDIALVGTLHYQGERGPHLLHATLPVGHIHHELGLIRRYGLDRSSEVLLSLVQCIEGGPGGRRNLTRRRSAGPRDQSTGSHCHTRPTGSCQQARGRHRTSRPSRGDPPLRRGDRLGAHTHKQRSGIRTRRFLIITPNAPPRSPPRRSKRARESSDDTVKAGCLRASLSTECASSTTQ